MMERVVLELLAKGRQKKVSVFMDHRVVGFAHVTHMKVDGRLKIDDR